MIVNFRTREINRGRYKLIQTLILIIKKKKQEERSQNAKESSL